MHSTYVHVHAVLIPLVRIINNNYLSTSITLTLQKFHGYFSCMFVLSTPGTEQM